MKIQTKITGIQFRGPAAASMLGSVEAPHEFILVREPGNKFDTNAIMVLCLHNGAGEPMSVEEVEAHLGIERDDEDFIKAASEHKIGAFHVGYVPKVDNGPFAYEMDEGGAVRAFSSDHEPYGLVLYSHDELDEIEDEQFGDQD